MLCTEIIPRSILMSVFEGTPYLLVALGDGSLFYFSIQAATRTLGDRKKVYRVLPSFTRLFRSICFYRIFPVFYRSISEVLY